MGDNTQNVTVSGIGNEHSETAVVHVPASVQREESICIDTEVEVTIEDIGGIFESVSFTNPQTAGDAVTVPAQVMRSTGIEAGEQYPISFEVVDTDVEWREFDPNDRDESIDDVPGAVSDDDLSDDTDDDTGVLEEIQNEADELVDEMADDEDDEEEEQGLGQLFG